MSYSFREGVKIIKESIFALLFPVIVLGGIYGGITTPTEAAAVSLVYVLFVEIFIYKNIKSLQSFTEMFGKAAVGAGPLTFILAAAQIFVWFVTVQQIPALIYRIISDSIPLSSIIFIAICLFSPNIDSHAFTGVVLTSTDYCLSRFTGNLLSSPP